MDPTHQSFRLYAEVLVSANINKILDYGIPAELEDRVTIGSVVKVPLQRKVTNDKYKFAIVLKIKDSSDFANVIQPIAGISYEGVTLPKDLIDLIFWISQYYFCPLGSTLSLFLPTVYSQTHSTKHQNNVFLGQNAERTQEIIKSIEDPHQIAVLRKLLKTTKPLTPKELIKKTDISTKILDSLSKQGFIRIVDSANLEIQDEQLQYFLPEPPTLTQEQIEAINTISQSLITTKFQTCLLFGVTGSGKTEVYLQVIRKARSLGKSVILLVPEVALTIQTLSFFKMHFGAEVGVLHYKLSESERTQTWHKAARGLINIIIGPRSAIFCPMQNLGLIIVDEEHDGAYKQSDLPPFYQARDVAVMRGKFTNATVILGSATPSLESYTNALSKKYTLSVLSKRASTSIPTKVSLIDMNREMEKTRKKILFSPTVIRSIEQRLAVGEQTIIFFNRRGFHTNVSCSSCKYTLKCPHCDMILTFHKTERILLCHLCNTRLSKPITSCPQCHGTMTLQYRGAGTEKIEALLQDFFPTARTIRLDSDTTRYRGSHDALIKQFATGKADILIGTQMIAKGMHFPAVTLSVVLSGDSGLYIPDFRAAEQVFQLITQVTGRSGRSYLPGEVLIQTFLPQNSTISHALAQDFPAFYKEEILGRKACNYPPFTRLIRCIFLGKCAEYTLQEAQRMHELIKQNLDAQASLMDISPCGHFKVKDLFHYQFLIKTRNILTVNKQLQDAFSAAKLSSKVRCIVDIDPITTFF
jgi:primosomal protein N''